MTTLDGSVGREAASTIARALRALGGAATTGDLVAVTALDSSRVGDALASLLAAGHAEVSVSESGDVVYHECDAAGRPESGQGTTRRWSARLRAGAVPHARASRLGFERKTLRLIRAREGVLSLAELVEHTGLSVDDARRELDRLSESYGGSWHTPLDGHTVCAFPDLMVSAHGRFDAREPRPAWVRAADPMDIAGGPRSGAVTLVDWAGLAGCGALGVLVTSVESGSPVALVAALAAVAGAFHFGKRLLRGLRSSRGLRYHDPATLRRYALGYVFQTALAGKGVVSLERTVRYLRARAGRRRVRRRVVELALRELAREFEAPITREGEDLFFGFRNVKLHFLASRLQRRRSRLARVPSGRTVFDSADSPASAAARDLESFDALLADPAPGAAVPQRAVASAPSRR